MRRYTIPHSHIDFNRQAAERTQTCIQTHEPKPTYTNADRYKDRYTVRQTDMHTHLHPGVHKLHHVLVVDPGEGVRQDEVNTSTNQLGLREPKHSEN